MKRFLALLGVTSLAMLGATATAVASPAESPNDDKKITICHATGSSTNPFVDITVSENALEAHLAHGDFSAGEYGCVAPVVDKDKDKDKDKDDVKDHKVSICHATGSSTNPFVDITVSENALEAHLAHGDFNLGQNGCVVDNDKDKDKDKEEVKDNDKDQKEVADNDKDKEEVKDHKQVPVVQQAPRGAVAAPPVGAGAVAAPVAANNPGFNVQTAVSEPDAGVAPWVGGLAAMLLAGVVIAARKVAAKNATGSGSIQQ